MTIFISCGSNEKSRDAKDVYDVAIIGAGGGGLSAAARLTQAGKKVIVIEQHSRVGGYMTNFKRKGYTFEVSLHAMDNLNPGRMNVDLLKDLGIYDKVKPVKADPMCKVFFPGLSMVFPADPLEFKKLLIEKFPEEKEGIEDFYEVTDEIDRFMDASLKVIRGDYSSGIRDIVTQPGAFFTFAKYINATADEFIKDYFRGKEALAIMTSLTGMLGDRLDNMSGLMFAGMWNGYHRGGYYNFNGGSYSVAKALEKVIKENGGEILLSTLVTKVIIEDGRAVAVKTQDNKEYKCRYVISNANAPDTFFKLIGEQHLPEDYIEDIKKMKIGPSTFVVFLGVNKDYRDCFPGTAHELMISSTMNPEENFKAWQDGDMAKMPFGIANYSKLDPNAAPAGKNAITIVSIMSYDWNNRWQRDKGYNEYKKLKDKVTEALIKRAAKYLPGLSRHIEVKEASTPLTNERYTLNPKGSIFGWATTLDQSLHKRLPQDTPIDNLFLAGAWTLPGGGQSVVLFSGYQAAGMVLDMIDE